MADPVVLARALTKRYGSFDAVRGIEFHVQPSECFGFLGSNGAGKTTTMRMIASSSPPSGGDLTVLGLPAWVEGRRIEARMGVVPQEDNLDEEVTVLENLVIYARYFDILPRTSVPLAKDLLAFVALEEKSDWKIPRLSGGMKAPADRPSPHERTGAAHPGRAHHGPRSAGSAPGVGEASFAQAAGRDAVAHHALHGGSLSALRPPGHHARGPHPGGGLAPGGDRTGNVPSRDRGVRTTRGDVGGGSLTFSRRWP